MGIRRVPHPGLHHAIGDGRCGNESDTFGIAQHAHSIRLNGEDAVVAGDGTAAWNSDVVHTTGEARQGDGGGTARSEELRLHEGTSLDGERAHLLNHVSGNTAGDLKRAAVQSQGGARTQTRNGNATAQGGEIELVVQLDDAAGAHSQRNAADDTADTTGRKLAEDIETTGAHGTAELEDAAVVHNRLTYVVLGGIENNGAGVAQDGGAIAHQRRAYHQVGIAGQLVRSTGRVTRIQADVEGRGAGAQTIGGIGVAAADVGNARSQSLARTADIGAVETLTILGGPQEPSAIADAAKIKGLGID